MNWAFYCILLLHRSFFGLGKLMQVDEAGRTLGLIFPRMGTSAGTLAHSMCGGTADAAGAVLCLLAPDIGAVSSQLTAAVMTTP